MERGVNIASLNSWVKKYLKYIQQKARILLVFAALGLSLGLFYSITYKPYYVSQLSFIINDGKSGNVNALSAIAGQLGIGGSGPTVTDDRILFLLSTKKVIGEVCLKKINGTNDAIGDRFISAFRLESLIYSDTFMQGFKGFTSPQMSEINHQESFAIDQIVGFIKLSNRFKIESVKRKANSLYGNQSNGIIALYFESRDEVLSKEFVNAIYLELTAFYSEAVLRNLQNNYDLLSNRADSIRNLLFETENRSAQASDDAYNVFRFRGKISEMRLRKEVEMLNVLYVEVLKNREFAKFSLDQERPLFQVVDEPILPLEKKLKSIPVFAILGSLAFTMLGAFGLSMIYLFKNENRIL